MFSSNTTQVSGGYEIQRSLRFNSADSAYLNRTPASAGNRKTWTWSAWIKRSELPGSRISLFACLFGGNDNSTFWLGFDENNRLAVGVNTVFLLQTSSVYRDVSAWYHVVLAVDTTQATAANRLKLYVNGTQITAFDTNNLATAVSQNMDLAINAAQPHTLGRIDLPAWYFPGYMTEVNFIDGQALTPSSFGAFDAQTGVWGPTRYAGSYGTNGFYLNFSDNSNTTAATLGKDYSGNSNNWTPNNFSVSAGAGNDSLVDVPTNWGTDTGVGGTVRGNYCTLNPLDKGANVSVADGNLTATVTSTGGIVLSTFGVSSGKWYWEMTRNGGADCVIGIANAFANRTAYLGFDSNGWGYIGSNGNKINNATSAAYGASYASGDVVGVALDMDAGTVTFYKNGSSQGTAYSGLTGIIFAAFGTGNNTDSVFANFGQRPFAYTAPSGFRALNTQNLPTPTIGATTATQANKYFDVVLRNGGGPSGSTYSTTINMANGAWLWDKPRNQASSHYVVDSVRGLSQFLSTNQTIAEAPIANWFTGFNNGSFTTGTNDWGSGVSIVDWIWAANGTGVTNTAGTVTSTVSANTTSGFSVVTYPAGTGTSFTIGHGLGVTPSFVITKSRSSASPWGVYYRNNGVNTNWMTLNTTDAQGSNAGALAGGAYMVMNSTTLQIDSSAWANVGPQLVAYVFAEVPGYSRFGSYVGNGSTDGPFVFCGFRPAYLLVKCSSNGNNWIVYDTTRDTINVAGKELLPNTADAEATYPILDFLSNGFKIRNSAGSVNGSAFAYIFAAFASAPQKFALAR